MNPFITIPRESLAELLRSAGSTLTPEQYLAELQKLQYSSPFKKYRSRAVAAAISKYSLLVVAILAVVLLPVLGFTFENIIITAGLITVTVFEYRVHRYFRENNPKAPDLGYRNQAIFAAAVLVYCLYHAFATFQIPHDAYNMMEENNVIDPAMLKTFVRIFYLFIAVLVGGSQFALACYYRGARMPGVTDFNGAPPPFPGG
jgi:hypothetical protein